MHFFLSFFFFLLVALNYQTEGRMLELNRAKFSANGNCGYTLKPKCMRKGKHVWALCLGAAHFWGFRNVPSFYSGAFNPTLEDPLPGRRKTQLVLKIISGQQLPKPKDSMFGDRGEVRLP